MQLLTLFALLGLLGSTLSKDAQPRFCKRRARDATGTCTRAENTLRFTYDPETGKCDQYWHSGCRQIRSKMNSFDNYTQCMRVCNSTSICLKRPEKFTGLIPIHKTFVFDLNTMKCEKKKSLRKPSIGDGYNRFKTEKDCNNTCVPNLVLIVKSFN
uniref:Putative kunitz-type peptidase inhibitor n=1 Tax=Amblyomma cajennense TaxID=34607 RepID=A0A023FSZ6_AMBCJ